MTSHGYFPAGLNPLLERGALKPGNGRVVLRVVTFAEIKACLNDGEEGLVGLEEDDLRRVAYHEVVSVADDVPEPLKSQLFPGALTRHTDAAGDSLDGPLRSARYVWVSYEHIYAVPALDREAFTAVCREVVEEQRESARARAELNKAGVRDLSVEEAMEHQNRRRASIGLQPLQSVEEFLEWVRDDAEESEAA